MAATTVSVEEFHGNVRAAQEAAQGGPVFIADGVGPQNVLLSIAAYRTLSSRATSLAEALSMPGLSDEAADFEFPKLEIVLKGADLS